LIYIKIFFATFVVKQDGDYVYINWRASTFEQGIILQEIHINLKCHKPMEAKKPKQSGRPRLEDALECVIPARFTQTEFEEIKQKSKGLKMSRSAYIRSMTLKGKVQNLFTSPTAHREAETAKAHRG